MCEWFVSRTSNVFVACLTGSTIKMFCYQGKLLHDLTLNKEEKVKTHEYIKHPLIQFLNICFLTGILSHENFAFDSNDYNFFLEAGLYNISR